MLTLSPLVAAISAGNAAVIKPSEVSAEVIARLVPQYLDCRAFSVVLGAVPETAALLEQQWMQEEMGIPRILKRARSAVAQHAH
jgi:aldehyde dehydrogenase (NAD+)